LSRCNADKPLFLLARIGGMIRTILAQNCTIIIIIDILVMFPGAMLVAACR